ncbi:MAG TPA: DUF4349 domain-containing protein [Planctomycetota bacterium]|nr:DUF4349 domain-containing protein [Planctomycetota bacterium]
MRHPPGFWLFLLTLLFAACQAQSDYWNTDVDDPSANRSEVFSLDDVTNGLPNNASRGLDAGSTGAAEIASLPVLETLTPHERGFGFTSFGDANDDGIPDQAVPKERLLVHRGELRVEVARPEEAMTSFRNQVVAWGGHLQSQTDHTLVVRVPAPHFEEAFAWVKQTGRVLSESRQAADVTEEFVDLGIRLDNARKARDRLLEILQKADKVEDILKVEAELRRLTEEIERMEGRKKFLADQVALSTLSATFQALADAPIKRGARQASRFPWINRIGAERVVEDFR